MSERTTFSRRRFVFGGLMATAGLGLLAACAPAAPATPAAPAAASCRAAATGRGGPAHSGARPGGARRRLRPGQAGRLEIRRLERRGRLFPEVERRIHQAHRHPDRLLRQRLGDQAREGPGRIPGQEGRRHPAHGRPEHSRSGRARHHRRRTTTWTKASSPRTSPTSSPRSGTRPSTTASSTDRRCTSIWAPSWPTTRR